MRVSFHSRKTSPAFASGASSCEMRFRARRRQPQARHWVYFACLGAAAFALLFLAVGVAYWHQDAPGSEATCAICHVAHLTPLPGSVVAAVSVPLLIARYELAETQREQPSPSLTNASPRAPPAR
jgi:peptidoglycan/LPS O-acetylase OafA/YrhL